MYRIRNWFQAIVDSKTIKNYLDSEAILMCGFFLGNEVTFHFYRYCEALEEQQKIKEKVKIKKRSTLLMYLKIVIFE